MSTLIAKARTLTLATLVAAAAAVPAAQADRGHRGDFRGDRQAHSYDRGDHHGRRGYWRNGKWIALGILGAAAAAAAANAYDRDCHYYRGRRYCE